MSCCIANVQVTCKKDTWQDHCKLLCSLIGKLTEADIAGDLLVSGVQMGNVWIGVQPALGVEGDPMRLLFERDLTPHPQYAAFYQWLQHDFQADAVLHFGMHGTVEWLPGAPLGKSRPPPSHHRIPPCPLLLSPSPHTHIRTKATPIAALEYNCLCYCRGRAIFGFYREAAACQK